MKDIHNHLLYGIDDGATDLDSSIEILDSLYERGVKEIVLTPHYIIGTNYNSNNKSKKKIKKELEEKSRVKLYLGNEVYIDNNIYEYICCGEISTINNSRYLLLEFPLKEKMSSMYDIIFDLRSKKIIPIIAHPERYHYLKIDDFCKLIEMGCLLQGNITSLVNKYGKKARLNLELLLKKHMIHVLGTDTHRYVNDLSMAYSKLKSLVDNEMYDELMNKNFDKIINDQDISAYKIISVGSLFYREKIK